MYDVWWEFGWFECQVQYIVCFLVLCCFYVGGQVQNYYVEKVVYQQVKYSGNVDLD